MNCSQWRNQILLEESGELSDIDINDLKTHLLKCRSCEAFRASVVFLSQTARDYVSDQQPGMSVMTEISRAARNKHESNVIFFPLPYLRVAACAAALVLVISGWFSISSYNRTKQVENVRVLVSMISSDYSEEQSEENAEDNSLQEVARQLLEMEGFTDSSDSDDLFSLLYEPEPTAFQEHNTGASRA